VPRIDGLDADIGRSREGARCSRGWQVHHRRRRGGQQAAEGDHEQQEAQTHDRGGNQGSFALVTAAKSSKVAVSPPT
jgi:hypothetical protein